MTTPTIISISDLQLELANNLGELGQLIINYKTKPQLVGYVTDMNDNTLSFTVSEMVTQNGKNGISYIDFPEIDTISVRYQRSYDNHKIFKVV